MRTVNRTAMVLSTLPLVALALSPISSQAGALDPADWTTFHFDNAVNPPTDDAFGRLYAFSLNGN